jgi:hypothetical protein
LDDNRVSPRNAAHNTPRHNRKHTQDMGSMAAVTKYKAEPYLDLNLQIP